MINTIIVEDNQNHVEKLTRLLKGNFSDINVLVVCTTVRQGIDAIRKYRPQLIFLDVQLEPGSGFEVLEQTRDIYYETIFTTSYNKYAVKAFRFCALDYIIKPFGAEELKSAIDRYKNLNANGTPPFFKSLETASDVKMQVSLPCCKDCPVQKITPDANGIFEVNMTLLN